MSLRHSTVIPYTTVLASTATYSGLLAILHKKQRSHDELRQLVKLISTYHSIAATGLTLLALSQDWLVPPHDKLPQTPATTMKISPGGLDDSANPLISGQNNLANLLTAWEAGYLIYDTGALFLLALHKARGSDRPQSATVRMIKDSPIFITHHILLASALLYLQRYISLGRQKGMKIIVSLLLMNASNSLLHLRWMRRKATGRNDARIDAVLAAVFAFTRFVTVYWVLKAYGAYHGLNAWEAMRRQRWQCQAGTGLLVSLNAVWWIGLVSRIGRSAKVGMTKKAI